MKKTYFNYNGKKVEIVENEESGIIWYNATLQGGKVLSWYTVENNLKGLFFKPARKICVVGLYNGGRVYKASRYLYGYRDTIEDITFVNEYTQCGFDYTYNNSPIALLIKKLGGIY